jgi:hypothetical protein
MPSYNNKRFNVKLFQDILNQNNEEEYLSTQSHSVSIDFGRLTIKNEVGEVLFEEVILQ